MVRVTADSLMALLRTTQDRRVFEVATGKTIVATFVRLTHSGLNGEYSWLSLPPKSLASGNATTFQPLTEDASSSR